MRLLLQKRRVLALAGVVVPLLAVFSTPVQADTTAGAGVMVGTINYSTGGIPLSLGCPASSFSLNLVSKDAGQGGAIVIEFPNNEFVGTLTVSGTGTDGFCSDLQDEFGMIPSISISGSNSVNQSSLTCSPVNTQFIRVFLHMDITYQGSCSVNGHAPVSALIAIEVDLVPQQVPSVGSTVSSFEASGPVLVQGD